MTQRHIGRQNSRATKSAMSRRCLSDRLTVGDVSLIVSQRLCVHHEARRLMVDGCAVCGAAESTQKTMIAVFPGVKHKILYQWNQC